jgi:hypothetical protein
MKTLNMLIAETVRLRDRLKEQGITLTVGETREALEAFQNNLHGVDLPSSLSDIQRELIALWYRRLGRREDMDSGEWSH